MTASSSTIDAALNVTGMDCASCVAHVEKAIKSVDGVVACQVNLARGRATVQFDPARTSPDRVADAINQSGYQATPEAPDAGQQAEVDRLARQHHEASSWFRRAMVGVVLWFPLETTHWLFKLLGIGHSGMAMPATVDWMAWTALATSTIAIVYVGGKFYRSAFSALRHGTTNMDVLITMGASVAYFYSLVLLIGGMLGWWATPPTDRLFFMEATGLLALISLGHWLEARARQSAGKAIHELLDLTPATALRLKRAADLPPSPQRGEGRGEGRTVVSLNILSAQSAPSVTPSGNTTPLDDTRLAPHPSPLPAGEREPESVPVGDLCPGDIILVRPGDRVPSDGVIVSGSSSVDEAMITGEPLPVTRTVNDKVIGGTLNRDGALQIRVTQVGAETALAQIVKLVETAQNSKPPVQKLADQISAVFVPSVLAVALVTGIGWYVYGTSVGLERGDLWAHLANAVCSVLIIACPCALGLAVPAALMVGTGRGAKNGVLLRDIDALQKAEKIDTIVLDKTGTITLGKPGVDQVCPADGMSADDLLSLAASVEQFSEHPLAKAIVEHAKQRGVAIRQPEKFSNEAGLGITATLGSRTILVGNERLVRSTGVPPVSDGAPWHGRDARATTSGTLVLIAERLGDETKLLGTISLTDTIKPDSLAAITSLHRRKLRTVLLSGDRQSTAESIAQQVGIDEVHGGVLPSGKAEVIRNLQSKGRNVAMVGDGINDAPALAQANLGIAIGSGSDIAKETGDIVLVSGSLHGIVTAIGLSRATMRVIRQNLFFAFFYNVLAIPLAATGHLNPLIAAAAMALSDVTVLGNALRLRRSKLD